MKENKSISPRNLAVIGVMTAITCILGPLSIRIPISPVPISFTNLAIYISVFVLGWKKGTISYLVYLLVGLVGIPVFSGFSAGLVKLAGPTGGYLIGFILMAVIGGWFVETFTGKVYMYILGLVLGTMMAYLFGTIWLAKVEGYTFYVALAGGVLPFLPGDAAKIIVAVLIGPVLQKRLKQAGVLS